MNTNLSLRYRAVAAAVGPREAASLARSVPSLEMDELARIFLTAAPALERRLQ